MKKKTLLCLMLTAAIFLSAFTTFRNEQGIFVLALPAIFGFNLLSGIQFYPFKQIFHKGNLIQLYSDYGNKRHLCRKFEYTL